MVFLPLALIRIDVSNSSRRRLRYLTPAPGYLLRHTSGTIQQGVLAELDQIAL